MKKILYLIGCMLTMWACDPSLSNKNSEEFIDGYDYEVETTAPQLSKRSKVSNHSGSSNVEAKIRRSAHINFQTQNTEKTKLLVDQCIVECGGIVINEDINNNDRRTTHNLHVHIPAQHLDSFLLRIEAGAMKVDYKEISQEDVTTQHIDLSTRLLNKQELEKKYLQLLTKANNINEILSIERELNQIRSDIESTTQQLAYLNQQIDYSSCRISFYKILPSNIHNGSVMLNALRAGLDNFVSFLMFCIRLWPCWILALLIGIPLYVKRRNKKQCKKS